MTKEEAIQIVDRCKNWNTSQRGFSEEEQAVCNARRSALEKAWRVLAENEDSLNEPSEEI